MAKERLKSITLTLKCPTDVDPGDAKLVDIFRAKAYFKCTCIDTVLPSRRADG